MGRLGAAAGALLAALLVSQAQAQNRPGPGTAGENRCRAFDPRLRAQRDVVIHDGRRRRTFAICIERARDQQVLVILDRRRSFTVESSPAQIMCRDADAYHIRLRMTKQTPPVSACPPLD